MSFRRFGPMTIGHPENFETRCVGVTTGPRGMGVSNAVGLAAAEGRLTAVYIKPGCTGVGHCTHTLAGGGCFQERETSISLTGDVAKRREAYGWQVLKVTDGDTDVEAVQGSVPLRHASLPPSRWGSGPWEPPWRGRPLGFLPLPLIGRGLGFGCPQLGAGLGLGMGRGAPLAVPAPRRAETEGAWSILGGACPGGPPAREPKWAG